MFYLRIKFLCELFLPTHNNKLVVGENMLLRSDRQIVDLNVEIKSFYIENSLSMVVYYVM